MQRFKLAYLISLFSIVIISLASCDPCRSVICLNGTCDQGACICDRGYEGSECGVLSRDKFVGDYNVNEQCNPGGAFVHSCTISVDSTDSAHVWLSNLFDAQVTGGVSDLVNAYVDSNRIVIPSQTLSGSGGDFVFFGTGTRDSVSGDITINYDVEVSGNPDECTATLKKK